MGSPAGTFYLPVVEAPAGLGRRQGDPARRRGGRYVSGLPLNSFRTELLENLLEVSRYVGSSAANRSNSAAVIGVSSFQVMPIGRSPVWLALEVLQFELDLAKTQVQGRAPYATRAMHRLLENILCLREILLLEEASPMAAKIQVAASHWRLGIGSIENAAVLGDGEVVRTRVFEFIPRRAESRDGIVNRTIQLLCSH